MKEIMKVTQITKDYGQGRGAFDLNFCVNEGEVLGFLGPNGAGKTTTIRQLMGFIKPQKGEISICGLECFRQASQIQKNVGYLPGEIAFIDSMTGIEFIKFEARMKGMKDFGRMEELMEMFELDASGKIKKMSKGMKQKIGIVCAFMQDPKILILDEPTSGLDPLMQNRFVELILSEKKRGKTILMSSHIFEEIEKTCDRAAIIRNGRLVSVDSMTNLQKQKKKKMCITFADKVMAEGFAAAFQVASETRAEEGEEAGRNQNTVVVTGSTVTFFLGSNTDEVIKLAAQYEVVDLDVQTQSLEEFFLHFYQGGKQV